MIPRPSQRGPVMLGICIVAASQAIALGAEAQEAAGMGFEEAPPDQGATENAGAELRTSPGWGFDVGAIGGLSMPGASDTQAAHVFAGGLARARWSYFQVGATFETTDASEESGERMQAIGGFAGAWLPYRRWLDFDAAAGLAMRSYASSDPRFGPDGYDVTNPALTLRFGVSGRTSESLFAARVGGAVFAALDVSRDTVEWRYEFGPSDARQAITGDQPVGGFTFGLLLNVGFDVDLEQRSVD